MPFIVDFLKEVLTVKKKRYSNNKSSDIEAFLKI